MGSIPMSDARLTTWQLLSPAICLALAVLAPGCSTEKTDRQPSTPGPTAPPAAAITAEAPPAPDNPDASAQQAPKPEAVNAEAEAQPEIIEAAPEPEPKPDPRAAERPQKVLILGDSLAATGIGALLEKKLDQHPDIDCARKGKSSSGLARPDFFDWMGEAKRQVKAHDPHLVVVLIGGNDGQDLTGKTKKIKRVHWQSDGWDAAYRERTDAFLKEIAGDNRKVLWLGLPKMGLSSFEKKLELIRGIQTEAVKAVGERATYFDTVPFTADGDQLLKKADVGNKKDQALRADDGIHFTMAGSEYFADKIYPEVVQSLGLEPAVDEKAAGE